MLFRLVTFLMCLHSCWIYAQSPLQVKRFFDKNNFECDSSKAQWFRIYKPKTDSSLSIEDYKISGDRIQVASAYCQRSKQKMHLSIDTTTQEQLKFFVKTCRIVLDGEQMGYSNGKLEFQGFCKDGSKQGVFTYWYFNGNKKGEFVYSDSFKIDYPYQIVTYYDSLGNQEVFNGEGTCTLRGKAEKIVETGKIVNGFKEGEWKGIASAYGKLSFTEHYISGKLYNGQSTDSTGNTYNYNELFVEAQYKNGGYPGLARLVGQNVKYPALARRMEIEGTVYLQFKVTHEGEIREIEVLRGINAQCDAEAERVLAMASHVNFDPALFRGKRVKSAYILPVSFRLE